MTKKIENNWKVNLVFLESDFANILLLFLEKKFFSDYQPFVCPCDVHCDNEHKQINLYLDKKILRQAIIRNCKSKRIRKNFTLFLQRKQKKCGFCDNYDNCIHCKKLKYIRQCLDKAYYFSPRKDPPWQPTHWKVFLYHKIDKEFEIIQKANFNFCIEIKCVRKSWTIDGHNNF